MRDCHRLESKPTGQQNAMQQKKESGTEKHSSGGTGKIQIQTVADRGHTNVMACFNKGLMVLRC